MIAVFLSRFYQILYRINESINGNKCNNGYNEPIPTAVRSGSVRKIAGNFRLLKFTGITRKYEIGDEQHKKDNDIFQSFHNEIVGC